jgi:aromatic-L-amino-acid decarboxylase
MTHHPLELSAEHFRGMVERATNAILEHVATLPSQPMHATKGGRKLARSLRESLPEHGADFDSLLHHLFEQVIPRSFNTASPGYLAYIPGGGLLHAAVADLVTDSVNRYIGVWVAAPGLAQIETNVVQWFAEIIGYGKTPTPGGLLTTGGSMANLIAIVTARESVCGEDFSRATIYVSDQAHHSLRKAARFAGFRVDQVRIVPTDERFRFDAGTLRERMDADSKAGLKPCLVVANAGTTNTGAVDDLEAASALAKSVGAWLHVDAAYGGFFAMTERGKTVLSGLALADSVTLDPHKSLFLPYGTGSLVVRDVEKLRRAHALTATYLPPMQEDSELADFCDLGPELSRELRGLRVWLPMKMHGAGAFREALDEKLDLARAACEAVRGMPNVEIVAEPELSLFVFRFRGTDEQNRTLLREINARQRVFITGTVLGGRFVLRACVLSFRTHADRMEMFVEDVRAAIDRL